MQISRMDESSGNCDESTFTAPTQYMVEKNDTLISISVKFGIPVSKLTRLNRTQLIGGNKVFEGMIIRLDGPSGGSIYSPDKNRSRSYEDLVAAAASPNSTTSTAPLQISSNSSTHTQPHNGTGTGVSPTPSFFSSIFSSLSNVAKNGEFLTNSLFGSSGQGPESTASSSSHMHSHSSSSSSSSSSSASQHSSSSPPSSSSAIGSHVAGNISPSLSNISLSSGASEFEDLEAAPREAWEAYDLPLIGDGKILTPDCHKQIRHRLPRTLQIDSMTLLYSMLNDGSDMSTFYQATVGNPYSVLIVETIAGEKFGGFISGEFKVSSSYYGSGECFVFKFDKKGTIEHYPWTTANQLFVYSTATEIGMGGDGDGFAFILDSDFATGSTNSCTTFGNPALTEQKGFFKIANVEAWGFSSYVARHKARRQQRNSQPKLSSGMALR